MIIIMARGASKEQVKNVVQWVEDQGYRTNVSAGEERTVIGVIGNERPLDGDQVQRMEGVEPDPKIPACRGVRGATTAASNSREDILSSTRDLLEQLVAANGLKPEDIASVFSHHDT